MPKSWLTNGREGVTRDTPLGVCHVTSRCPATPTVTHRDNVTSCHAVTHWRSWHRAKNGSQVFSGVLARQWCTNPPGCGRAVPYIDHLALLWLLNGGRVVELYRDREIIVTERCAPQCYRRRPVEVGRVVLAWEIAQ
jgi:hypothetical protein